MAADSVHGAIGKKFKKASVVATFDDFFALCDTATKCTKAVLLDLPYIFNIRKECRSRSIKHFIPHSKGKKNMFVKIAFRDNTHSEIDFLRPKFVNANKWKIFPDALGERRGITSGKKNGIIKVLKGIPSEKKGFWRNIDTKEAVPGLATARDAGEIEEH